MFNMHIIFGNIEGNDKISRQYTYSIINCTTFFVWKRNGHDFNISSDLNCVSKDNCDEDSSN